MTRVLFEDAGLLAVDKPEGALSVRGRLGAEEPSLVDLLSRERGEKLFIVHRLDRGTSGVLLVARDAATHRALNEAFEAGRVQKRYLALIEGEPPEDEFTVELPLVPARRGKSRPAAPGEQGKPARTDFRVLERFRGFALVEARPRTGRSHQIRVHLKSLRLPLAVDPLYGTREVLTRADLGLAPGDEVVLARTPLHARSLSLAHPVTGAPLNIESPLPADLERALELLRQR